MWKGDNKLKNSDFSTDCNTLAIDEQTQRRLEQVSSADIIVGIPSYKSLKSIGRVVKAAELGLAKYFSQYKGVILVSEGGSVQETQNAIDARKDELYFDQAFVSKPAFKTEILVANYNGTAGKGTALKAIFEAAKILGVKAGCLIDSDIRSISPEWIELLIAPVILNDFGFVAPYYTRHKYDGTITNMIAYPLTRALYGRRVRQPIGGDFGFSLELAERLLSKDVWETDIAKFGIDIWMTTVAICENFKICQSFLGAKIHEGKDPGKDLVSMFKQVVGTIFSLMDIYHEKWLHIKGSRPTAIFGFESEFASKPVDIDIRNLIDKFKTDIPKHVPLLKKILDTENYYKIHEVVKMGYSDFELPVDLWVKSLYDFALAYKMRRDELGADNIIEALVPIYFAKTASFVNKTRHAESKKAEEIISKYCTVFENFKPYLVNRWASKVP